MEFNLQKWQQGAKVCTRSGFEVENLTHFPTASDYQLVGLVRGEIFTWTKNGKFDIEKYEHSDDLVFEEPESWVYAYRNKNGTLMTSVIVYPTIDEAIGDAKKYISPERFAGIYKLEVYDI